MNRQSIVRLGAVAAFLALGLTGCGKASEPDAPSTGKNESSPAKVFSNVDGFSNWDEKCDQSGHLIVVIYHGDGSYGAVTMVFDPKACPKAGPPVALSDQG